MPIMMLDQVEFNGIPPLNFSLPVVTSDPAPSAALEGRVIYNTTANVVKYCDGATWIVLDALGAAGPPNGAAGGDLTGSYPNPSIAAGVIVDADVSAGAAIDQNKIAGLGASLVGKADASKIMIAGNGLAGGGDLSSNRTFDVGAGSGITVAADSVAVDTVWGDARYLTKTGGTMSGVLTLSGNPSGANDAANKAYVDITSQGFSFKSAVRIVASTNIGLSGLAAIDGITPIANDRVLAAGQTTASQNGIYLAASGAWTRATDMDASGELVDGTLVAVGSGTANADSQWICTATGATPWVPGSSTSTWSKFTSLQDLQAGAGLLKTGNVVDIVAGDGTINVAADSINVLSAPKWTTARVITLTGDVTGTSPSIDGTGNVSIATTFVGGTNLAKHFSGDVPAGTICAVQHNLGTRDVAVEIYRTTTPWDTVQCTIERPDLNSVVLRFASSVTAGQYRAVVQGR